MSRRILFYCPEMVEVAQQLVKFSEEYRAEQIAKGEEPDAAIELGVIDWNRFPDGWPDLMIRDIDGIRRSNVTVLLAFTSPAVVYEQWTAARRIARYRPKSFRVLLPYFPTGTMEREDTEGQVATAESLAALMSVMPPAGPGPVPLYIWDLHALAVVGNFDCNHVSVQPKSGMRLLQDYMKSNGQSVIAFPDAGAYKRYRVMFTERDKKFWYDFILCRKERDKHDKAKRVVVIEEGDPKSKNITIIDDLGHSCGTLIECCKALLAAGAKSVRCFVTHGVMENDNWRKLIDAGFEEVIIMDTCPDTARAVQGVAPFRVLSAVPSMYDAIFDR